ncbi:MAG: type II toxin-antitoxin system HicB family antitoxin [Bryobacteraceae bacterium]|nr:type II toxin-antitoxin system HicB family antitoxin [Bryobacteraceae bacterium]
MLTAYLEAAMRRAHYELLEDEQAFYGEIPDCQGVWARGKTLEECREELRSALEDWLLFRLSRQLPVPPIGEIDLSVREVA